MIQIFLSLLFCWLIFREIFNRDERFSSFSFWYIVVLASLATASAWTPVKTWRLENYLSKKASIIAERPNVKVKCNSLFDSIISGRAIDNVAGTAYIEVGEIFFEHGWCKNFMEYMSNPNAPSQKALFSMHVFTHEVMHIRGERNERKTDCQAIQRNHQVGVLLGISAEVARNNAIEYYRTAYQNHPYFDKQCRPRGKLDENLSDSIW